MNFKEVCRTCLASSGSERSISSSIRLENFEVIELPILDLLKVFNISVSPTDSLPDKICCDCFNKIQKSYTFKTKLEKAQSILKELKDNEKSMNNLNEYEHYTEEFVEVIKTENYYASNNEQDPISIPDSKQGFTKREVFLVQEVKQEPEIEINMEEIDFDEKIMNTRKLKCTTCSKLFHKKYKLHQHMRIHTGEKPFQCKECPQKYRLRGSLKMHTQRTHADITTRKFKCVTCLKFFEYKSELDAHMTTHTGEKPFQCEICPNKYRLKGSFTAHMQTAHADKTNIREFICEICSKIFRQRCMLHDHMRLHTGEKPFKCEICPKKYRLKVSLKVHMQRAHAHNTRKFECETCSKLFECRARLKEHVRLHTGEKPFHCEVCMKKFRVKRSLTEHMKIKHSDKRNVNAKKFNCVMCSKFYRHKYKLDEHIRIHTGEQPYECEICPKKFRLKGSLKVHVQRSHADITDNTRKFKCATCAKLFKREDQLTEHMRIHTVEMPLQHEKPYIAKKL